MAADCTTPENPFSSSRIRPGATPFIFPRDFDAESLVARLRQNRWRGEITGPHGCGKSSLLAAIMPEINRAGRKPLLIELHDGQRRLPVDLDEKCRAEPFDLAVIDGYEQLGRLARWRLGWLSRRRGWGLLVTAHVSVGLPSICRLTPTAELTERIVKQLTADRGVEFSPADLRERFVRHGGDLREMLFELYDEVEHISK
jgi:hypothetical protein